MNIGFSSVKCNATKSDKFQVNMEMHRSLITDTTIYTFKNAYGKQEKYKLACDRDITPEKFANINSFFMAFNKYSTDDNPEITPEELFQIKKNIKKGTYPTQDKDLLAKTADYFQLLDLYADKNSEKGELITPTEQAEIISVFAKRWFAADNLFRK